MFSNSRSVHKNGSESHLHSFSPVYSSTLRNNISNPKAKKKMDVKLFLTICGWIGIPGSIAAFILNINTWKSDFIFYVGATFLVVRVLAYCWRTWQLIRQNELDIKKRKKDLLRE